MQDERTAEARQLLSDACITYAAVEVGARLVCEVEPNGGPGTHAAEQKRADALSALCDALGGLLELDREGVN